MLEPKKYIIYSGLILAEPAITVDKNRHGISPELVRLPGYYGRFTAAGICTLAGEARANRLSYDLVGQPCTSPLHHKKHIKS